ncbi:hypothetical protein EIP86_007320 [Pleurotus ostreatoroseus]|nr:hypothetical protein EIP86_007320 [Pleurotus ostreatoroseus]
MSTMATPPLSSSSSSASSPSPSFQSPENPLKQAPDGLSFDDPDALELLLQTITQNVDSPSSHHEDWSQMSSWGQQTAKMPEMSSDFGLAFPPMDLDFDPNMAVDPSALHFNPSIFTQPRVNDAPYFPQDYSASELSTMFPYSNTNTWSQPHIESATGRRLSITSLSSSSGASLSPILEPQTTVHSSPRSDYASSDSDPASELAHRVRQAAGVTLAVPVSAQVQQLAAAGGQAKLPIPRLPRALPHAQNPGLKRAGSAKSVSPLPDLSPASSPPATSPSDSDAAPSSAQSPESSTPTTTVLGRPKTSHTTIERRYRTNLNARITGLKHAVPALRVLEAKDGNQPWNDIVDARGFVDGVKVARKMSKANVLGKATEYIRVLKKREARLKREQDGLKSLVAGLVGGPALLKEWEREWKDRFGGEERDEVEGEDLAAQSDDEDGDGDDSDGDDDEGRARKKPKIAKAPKKEKPSKPVLQASTLPAVPGAVPEKRKRGRPRKVPLPTPVPSTSTAPSATQSPIIPTDNPAAHAAPEPAMSAQQEYMMAQGSQTTPQYLLAAFAFFSLWNSPLANNYAKPHTHDGAHAHHGAVLTAHPTMVPTNTTLPAPAYGYGVHEVVQAFHLLVSTLVFFYIVFPWLSGVLRHSQAASAVLRRVQAYLALKDYDAGAPAAGDVSPKAKSQQRVALVDALAPASRGLPDEAGRLRRALGVSTGVYGLLQGVIKAARIDRGLEMNQLEQRAWVRLGELVACNADTVSKTTRLQTFWCMSWHVSTFATSTSDLATLALIILPISSSKAASLWDRARNQEVPRPHERIVLAHLSVEDAAELLAKWRRWHDAERRTRCTACERRTPLGVLAAILIRERLRKHAAALFVRAVAAQDAEACDLNAEVDIDADAEEPLDDERAAKERKETIEAGTSIGGRTAQLAVALARIWDAAGFCAPEDLAARPVTGAAPAEDEDEAAECMDAHDLASTDEAEIRCLLGATLLYRRIFPASAPASASAVSAILSPPPSPSRKNLALHMSLRAALASPAFDFADERLEDGSLSAALDRARDKVNDLLTAVERSVRRNIRL